MRDAMKAVLLVVVLAGAVACSKSPAAPSTAPAPTTYTLSGTVRGSDGAVVSGATVLILDSANAGRSAATGTGGTYQLTGLQSAGFSARVTAADFEPFTRGLTITADTVADFTLTRLPRAILTNVAQEIVGTREPGGTYGFTPVGQNTGSGCAGSISGVTTITKDGATLLAAPWSLPLSTIVRPGERFSYSISGVSSDVAFSGGVWFTRFNFVTVAC